MTDSNSKEFSFNVPPEAPCFQPTEEEFADPLLYIEKIRPVAEKFGICKIKSPENWKPPFSLDVENLRFTSRIQCLNLLEAKTRVKVNFLNRLALFWEIRGITLKVPKFDNGVVLDLYTLYKLVETNGGYIRVNYQNKWPVITKQLGMDESYAKNVFINYKQILKPYDSFCKNQNQNNLNERYEKSCSDDEVPVENKTDDLANVCTDSELNLTTFYKELRRLTFCGAGPKMADYNNVFSLPSRRSSTSGLMQNFCAKCTKKNYDESMYFCFSCRNNYHEACVPSMFNKISNESFCPSCIRAKLDKPIEPFGMPYSKKEYSLQEFGKMAESFKTNYFNTPVHLLTSTEIEKEYWRLMNAFSEKVIVEYGADLHTSDHGSGFPTKKSRNLNNEDLKYVESKWNLNNLPVIKGSILNYITGDIPGIKLPWMYVGMLFSTFCWHTEDHWMYSINFLHWGEPKTWYSVPSNYAEQFELTMQNYAPELFQNQPDLLNQLVTSMNLNVLMDCGIPVYRTDQLAGEFVITFPRAYHTGFNQGYNFAESVNFAPPEWLKIGRACISHYSNLRRFCVFSHDELICRMAMLAKELDSVIATLVYNDASQMYIEEKSQRRIVFEWGIRRYKLLLFEAISDDERQCSVCNTTCFLSALTCECSEYNKKMVCLRHYKLVCNQCPPEKCIIYYRYSMDEFVLLLNNLRLKTESFDTWLENVKRALDCSNQQKPTINYLKSLYITAVVNNFPEHALVAILKDRISIAEKCQDLVDSIHEQTLRTDLTRKLSINELIQLYQEISSIQCDIQHSILVEKLYSFVKHFQEYFEDEILLNWNEQYLKKLEYAYSVVTNEDPNLLKVVDFPNMKQLEVRLEQVKWFLNVNTCMNTKIELDVLKKIIEAGLSLKKHPKIEEKLDVLQEILTKATKWESDAKNCLSFKTIDCLNIMKPLLKESSLIPINLPTYHVLASTFNLLNNWLLLFKDLRKNPKYDTIKLIVNRGENLPMRLTVVTELQNRIRLADEWKITLENVFLLDNTKYNIIEVIGPRGCKFPKSNTSLLSVLDIATCNEFFSYKTKQLFNYAKIRKGKSVCICRKPNAGIMIKCSLCFNLYHLNSCMQMREDISEYISRYGFINKQEQILRYYCSQCLRSKQPKFEIIIDLLQQINKIGIITVESQTLQFLYERYIKWFNCIKEVSKALITNEWNFQFDHDYLKLGTTNERMFETLCDFLLESDLMGVALDNSILSVIANQIYRLHSDTDFLNVFYDFHNPVIDLTSETEDEEIQRPSVIVESNLDE